MTELILDTSALPSYLANILNSTKVIVREANKVVTIMPATKSDAKIYKCPFLGIAADSNITVDKFLAWKKEEREAEYEKELRS